MCLVHETAAAALWVILAISAGLGLPRPMAAQEIAWAGVPVLGGPAEDDLRTAQLLGEASPTGFLLRTPSGLLTHFLEEESNWSLTLLTPEFRSVSNSHLPFTFNDGPLWAGKGWNGMLTVGARVRAGPLVLVLSPQVTTQANKPFQSIMYPLDEPHRKLHANPFHPPPESLDLPIRFGDEKFSEVFPGQSSLTLEAGPLAAGVATENQWWGPGIRNGILMSGHGPGFPHGFLRTLRPLETPYGSFEALWMLGRLEESDYFDFDSSNDHRTINGAALVYQSAFDPGFFLGIARTVFAPLPQGESEWSAAFDAFRSVGRPNRKERNTPAPPGPDQILSVFGRWVLPPHGVEVYGEWARFEEAASFRDFLEFPQHSQGYTLGFQWLSPPYEWAHSPGAPFRFRVQAELTNLEPSGTWRHREPFSSYASSVVPQGYTHRGQMIGAGIGPGSSSQWVAMDYLPSEGRFGAFAGRIRWDAAAWLTDAVKQWSREDVSMFWGLRGGLDFLGWSVLAELSHGVRINYLFQTFSADPITGRAEGVDIANTSFSLILSKQLWRVDFD